MDNKDKMIGKRFGRLVVTSFSRKAPKYVKFYNVQCDCGNTKEVRVSSLQGGHSRSCGCLLKEARKGGFMKRIEV